MALIIKLNNDQQNTAKTIKDSAAYIIYTPGGIQWR